MVCKKAMGLNPGYMREVKRLVTLIQDSFSTFQALFILDIASGEILLTKGEAVDPDHTKMYLAAIEASMLLGETIGGSSCHSIVLEGKKTANHTYIINNTFSITILCHSNKPLTVEKDAVVKDSIQNLSRILATIKEYN